MQALQEAQVRLIFAPQAWPLLRMLGGHPVNDAGVSITAAWYDAAIQRRQVCFFLTLRLSVTFHLNLCHFCMNLKAWCFWPADKKKVWLVLVQICNFSTQCDGLAQGRLCSRALSQCATPAGHEPPGEALLLTSATRPLETISAHFLLCGEVTGGCKAAGITVCVQAHCAKSWDFC